MDIGKNVISSVRWLGFSKLIGQVFAWVITIVIVRILSPQDYGLIAMSSVVVGFGELFREIGMGSALIQRDSFDHSLNRTIFGFLIVFNAIVYVCLFSLAPLVSTFFGEPRLKDIIIISALQFPLSSFATIPNALLSRKMDFKKRSIIDLIRTVAESGSALVLALAGFGVWSLVWGNLIGVLILTIGLILITRAIYLPQFSFSRIESVIKFGGTITIEQTLFFIFSRSDYFIIGKLLGKEALGFYSVAKHLATLPMQKISGILNQVGFAAFSRIKTEKETLSRHLCKAGMVISFISFPTFWGISSVSPEIVQLFLGEKWGAVVFPLQVLSFIVPFQMLSLIISPAILGVGRPDVNVINRAFACLVMPISFGVGANWGLVGVSLAWVFGYPIVLAFVSVQSLSLLKIPLFDFYNPIKWPLVSGLAMYLTVSSSRAFSGVYFNGNLMGLILLIFVGAISYCALSYLFNRYQLLETFKVLKGAS